MKHFCTSLFLAALLGAGCVSSPKTAERPFDFALIGDVPYNADQETRQLPNLMRELNAAKLEFVVHDGDIKSGDTPCSDEVFEARQRDFENSAHPFIYVFGDNEWTDCGRGTNRFNSVERLQKLREVFCAGDQTLGRRKLPLARQSNEAYHAKFRENVRWEMGGVMFLTMNVPGSLNNYGSAEFAERNAANLAWLHNSFAFAKLDNARAIMLVIQANPLPERGSTNRVHPGYRPLVEALEQEAVDFPHPVVLVHGDSHYFRIDKPFYGAKSKRRIENLTRVETFGNPDVHWIRVTVDPQDPDVFTFRPQLVRSNLVRHGAAGSVK